MSSLLASREFMRLLWPIVLGAAIGVFVLGAVLLVQDQESSIAIVDTDNETIQVWLEGEVERPGLYALDPSSTVGDLLDLAGGPDNDADVSRLDLTRPVADGAQVVVPARESVARSESDGDPTGPIDINQASAPQLELLPGIGPVLAGRIVDYRDVNGPFASPEQLAEVRGISPSMVEEMRDMLTGGQ